MVYDDERWTMEDVTHGWAVNAMFLHFTVMHTNKYGGA